MLNRCCNKTERYAKGNMKIILHNKIFFSRKTKCANDMKVSGLDQHQN
jgi:hypothetical protein